MEKAKEPLLSARPSGLPHFRRLPLGGLLMSLLTLSVGAAMLCLAFVIFSHGLPLSVWLPLVAVLINLVSSAMFSIYGQGLQQGDDPAELGRILYRPAFIVGVVGLAVAISAAVPFFVLTA